MLKDYYATSTKADPSVATNNTVCLVAACDLAREVVSRLSESESLNTTPQRTDGAFAELIYTKVIGKVNKAG